MVCFLRSSSWNHDVSNSFLNSIAVGLTGAPVFPCALHTVNGTVLVGTVASGEKRVILGIVLSVSRTSVLGAYKNVEAIVKDNLNG